MPPGHTLKKSFSSLQHANAYICPTCSVRNIVNRVATPKQLGLRPHHGARRAASTITSVTAVNAKKDVPHAFRELYDALGGLQNEAAIYTNLSQLQLALRGLESENGVTRAAGRHGEELELNQKHPLVRTLSLPSRVLQSHNLEVLIQSASTQSEEDGIGAQGYLVPGLETPSSATGRFSTVTYPVHKALVLTHNLDGIKPLLSSASSSGSGVRKNMVTVVVNTPWSSLSANGHPMHPVNPINLARAEQAIETFRQSIDNSFNYEHAWFESGMPAISAWLIEGTEALPAILKPTIRRLVETLATNVEQAIDREESEQSQNQASTVVPSSTRDLMNTYISNWAEAAHTELRDQLDIAFISRNWRKLAWWKLAWRVDDVTYITSDILRQSWLVEADRGIIYLYGRIEQAGLLPLLPDDPSASTTSLNSNPYQNTPNTTTSDPLPEDTIPLSELIPASAFPTSPSPTTHPLSLTNTSIPDIAKTREYLLATTIPPLQSLAQRLLLHALSTTVFTSGASALIY
ncbi:MAG: hypothetical protein Q9170_008016, partial [Blastenia crenularia]